MQKGQALDRGRAEQLLYWTLHFKENIARSENVVPCHNLNIQALDPGTLQLFHV